MESDDDDNSSDLSDRSEDDEEADAISVNTAAGLFPFWIIIGSYEQTIHGYLIHGFLQGSKPKILAEQQFAYSPHIGSIVAVAGCWPRACSGSNDETVRIYDIQKQRELGTISAHQSKISAVAMPSASTILSAAEDGIIHVWGGHNWDLMTTFGGHSGPLVALAVHPTRRLVISACAADRSIRTWNLLNGHCVHKQVIPRGFTLQKVVWSEDPQGSYFAILFAAPTHLSKANVFIFSTATGEQVGFIEPERQVLSICFIGDSFLAVAGEETVIRVYALPDDDDDDDDEPKDLEAKLARMAEPLKVAVTLRGHEKRIAAMSSMTSPAEFDPDSDQEVGGPILVSASTDGVVILWDMSEGRQVGHIRTGAHVTSMALVSMNEPHSGDSDFKRQRKSGDFEDSDDEDDSDFDDDSDSDSDSDSDD